MKLDPDEPASLIWLPEGELPSNADFGTAEQRWTFEAAVKHAYETMQDHDKTPWLRVGSDVLGPDGIRQARSGLRAMGLLR